VVLRLIMSEARVRARKEATCAGIETPVSALLPDEPAGVDHRWRLQSHKRGIEPSARVGVTALYYDTTSQHITVDYLAFVEAMRIQEGW
jgi:hypothetical protein